MKEFCFGSFPVILDIVREWMRGAQYSHDVPFEVLEHLQGLGQIAAGFALRAILRARILILDGTGRPY